jgi:Rieske Fe-S protein
MAVTRRRLVDWFLGSTLSALAAAVLYPVLRFLTPPETTEVGGSEVEVGAVNDPAFVSKGYRIVRLGGEPVIVVRVADNDFRAFSATCTHLACIVEYRRDRQALWCNCHDGQFNLQGQVAGGPPPRPLRTYAVNLVPGGAEGVARVVVSRS